MSASVDKNVVCHLDQSKVIAAFSLGPLVLTVGVSAGLWQHPQDGWGRGNGGEQ